MEKLLKWIKSNVSFAYIIGLFILFGLAHLWEPIIYAYYVAFAYGFCYFAWHKYLKFKFK
jgi:hypothetical protein